MMEHTDGRVKSLNHVRWRIGVKNSAQCPCGEVDQTLEHYLQSCSPPALGVCRGFVPSLLVCGTHGREDLVNATITSNAEEEDVRCFRGKTYDHVSWLIEVLVEPLLNPLAFNFHAKREEDTRRGEGREGLADLASVNARGLKGFPIFSHLLDDK